MNKSVRSEENRIKLIEVYKEVFSFISKATFVLIFIAAQMLQQLGSQHRFRKIGCLAFAGGIELLLGNLVKGGCF